MAEKHYLRSDGNGGVNISMSMIALSSLVILILGTLGSSVYAYGTLNSKVDNINKFIDDNYQKRIDWGSSLEGRVNNCEQNYAVISSKLDTIQRDIIEVKTDVKEHISDSKS